MACHLPKLTCRTLVLLAIVSYPAFAANPKLIIRNARIMTMASNQREPINGYLSISPDGTILAVAAGEPPANLHADKIVDAHGDVAPAHVNDPMTMVLRENAIQGNLVRWDDERYRYVLTGSGRRRISTRGSTRARWPASSVSVNERRRRDSAW